MVRIRFLFILISFLPTSLIAQYADSTTTQPINSRRLATFVTSASVLYTGSLIGLSELWYKESEQQKFQFFNDNSEWKQVDKIGHFYSTFYISNGTARALRWGNVKQSKADLIGALTGCLAMLPIEILDGYSNDYGASTGDLLANAGGSLFYFTQAAIWKEIRIWPKFSFHNTRYSSLRPALLGDNVTSKILKDYNGQTYWLSFDVDKFMEFPKWLNIAVGYGAERMVYARDSENLANGYESFRQYYIAFDLDLSAIKTNSKFMKSLLYFANMIKIPAPTIEFSKKGCRFHPYYF